MPKEGSGIEPGLLTPLSPEPGAFLAGLAWSLCTWLSKSGEVEDTREGGTWLSKSGEGGHQRADSDRVHLRTLELP